MRGDQRQQPQPHRLPDGLEHASQLASLLRRQRLPQHRRAAQLRLTSLPLLFRHCSILTVVNSTSKLRAVVFRCLSNCGVVMSRIQLALRVGDLDGSIAFYSKLFGTGPAKLRPGYANFAVAEPPLKL